MNRYTLLFFLLFAGLSGRAQQELGLHFMQENWYARNTNPAFYTPSKLVIGLPGVYNNLLITNIVYNDLVVEENGKKILDIDRGIDKLGASNKIRENLVVETIQIGFKLNKALVTLGHAVRFNAFLDYPKTLPQLIWQGNSQFIGQAVDFGADTQLFGYNEFSLGLTLPITENLYIGGRAKYLTGFGDISTERSELSLYTDDDIYALRLDADLLVNNAGEIAYNGFRDITVDYDFGRFEGSDLLTGNRGYAFDAGAHLQLGRLSLSASVLDLGQINWTSSVANYELTGDYEFDGLDLADEILEDATAIGSVVDTLIDTYPIRESSRSYSTSLGYKTYVSAGFQFTERWRLGLLFHGEQYRDEFYPALALGGTARLTNWLTAGAHYAWRNDAYDNLGLNLQLQLGPARLLAGTDNLLTAFRLKNSNNANARIGLYFAFGRAESTENKETSPAWY